MNIQRIEVGQMHANCFVIWDDTNEAVIIDPGDDAELIISIIQRNNLTPRLIIVTHGNVDHIMAVLELKLAFDIPFYMHRLDQFLLDNMARSAMHFLNFDPGPSPEVDIFIENGSKINVGELELEIIHTPGHTPGSVCLYSRKTSDMFVGDLIFKGGSIGRTDFKYSDKQSLLKSIRQILKLPSETNVHSGHDESFLLYEFPSFQ